MGYKIKNKTVRIYTTLAIASKTADKDYICHVLIHVKIGKMFHLVQKHSFATHNHAVYAVPSPDFFDDMAAMQKHASAALREANRDYYQSENWHWLVKPSILFSRDLGHHFTHNVRHFMLKLQSHTADAIDKNHLEAVKHLAMNNPINTKTLSDNVRRLAYEGKFEGAVFAFNSIPKSVNNPMFGGW